MYWLSMTFLYPFPVELKECRLTPHLGSKKDAKLFMDVLCRLCSDSHFSCKIKLYKNTEVIRRAIID